MVGLTLSFSTITSVTKNIPFIKNNSSDLVAFDFNSIFFLSLKIFRISTKDDSDSILSFKCLRVKKGD